MNEGENFRWGNQKVPTKRTRTGRDHHNLSYVADDRAQVNRENHPQDTNANVAMAPT